MEKHTFWYRLPPAAVARVFSEALTGGRRGVLYWARYAVGVLALCIVLQAGAPPAVAAVSSSCDLATSATSHAFCWLDLSNYAAVSGSGTSMTSNGPVQMTFTLPDNSTLSLTIKTTVASPGSNTTLSMFSVPTWVKSSLGVSEYVGIPGSPVIYVQAAPPVTTVLSGITLKDPTGKQLTTATMAGADAESTDEASGSIGWTSTGSALTQLELFKSSTGQTTPICTLTGLGTAAATCSVGGTNLTTPVAGYLLDSAVTSSQTFGMNALDSGTQRQGYAFAVDIAQLTNALTLGGRSSATDQFAVNIVRAATTLTANPTTNSTTGTGTTASTSLGVFPTDAYTLTDSAASGSSPDFSNYVSTYACANAVSSATALPSGTGTSIVITPILDDQITCTFTNNALTLTNSVSAAQSVFAPTTVTDTFTLTNTSVIPATFTIGSIAVIGSTSGSITPSGYIFGGTTYPTLTAAQAAITAAGATAANGSFSFKVKYSAPGTAQTISTTLAATDSSTGSTSTSVSATGTDTMGTGVTVSKTGTTATSPGGIIAWTILATNTGPSANNNSVFSDPIPAGLTISGTPTCGSATGGAVCGTVSVSGSSVTSTIVTFPAFGSVLFSISAKAGASGTYTNTATLTPTSGSAATSSLTTTVAQSNGLNETVRNITKGDSTGATTNIALPGDTLEFALSFTNTTGTALQNFKFSTPLPANVTFATAACGSLPSGVTTCTAVTPSVGASGTVTFTFNGSLASGGTLTATIRVVVT